PRRRSYRPQPELRSRCRSDCSSKNRCQASFVCPFKSPQKLSFISARKCWKCSLIGIIFAIGCRSPFQERLSLVRQSQLTPSRLYTINVTSPLRRAPFARPGEVPWARCDGTYLAALEYPMLCPHEILCGSLLELWTRLPRKQTARRSPWMSRLMFF